MINKSTFYFFWMILYFNAIKKLFQGIKCMGSSVSDNTKEIACTTYFSKLSEKTKQNENDYHSCEHFVAYLFHNFSHV